MTISRPPPIGLGVTLSEDAAAELKKMIDDYLSAADMMVAENEKNYPALTSEVREQCPDVPLGAI